MKKDRIDNADKQIWACQAIKRMGRKVDELLLGKHNVGEDNHEGETSHHPTEIARNVSPPLRINVTNEGNRDTVQDIDLGQIMRDSSDVKHGRPVFAEERQSGKIEIPAERHVLPDPTLPRSINMAEPFKGKVAEKMDAPDGDKSVGDRVAEGIERRGDCFGERKGVLGIKDSMDVIASCGRKMGEVDHVAGGIIELANTPTSDRRHHFIPTAWVHHVDNHVHLSKNSEETERQWKSDITICGC